MYTLNVQVTGNSASLVGDGLLVGGLIAAPFTLGVSLTFSALGIGACALGGLTSAGAGIAEFFISKQKMAAIKRVVEEDNALSNEIAELWECITGKCTELSERYTNFSLEDIYGVLLVCAMKVIGNNPTATDLERVSYVADFASGLGCGALSVKNGCQATGGVILTALLVRFAPKGAKALTHCSKIAGIPQKVVIAAKVLRFGTGIGVFSIAFTGVGVGVDLISLIYNSYQIHKKSDSNVGKALRRRQKELQESKERLENLKSSLSDIL